VAIDGLAIFQPWVLSDEFAPVSAWAQSTERNLQTGVDRRPTAEIYGAVRNIDPAHTVPRFERTEAKLVPAADFPAVTRPAHAHQL
jgi:hypothetical protein